MASFFSMFATLIFFLAIIWVCSTSIVITKNKHISILETFGKFSGVREAGLSFKLPAPFQTVAGSMPVFIQELNDILELKTKDNLFIKYPIKVQYQITDAVKARYELENPKHQMMSYIANLVRGQVGKRTFLELYDLKDELRHEIEEVLEDKISSYGFKIIDVLVDQPIPTEEVQRAYNNVTSSEREKEASKNRAEAARVTIVEEATAQKEAKRLQGEGIALQRKAIAEGFSGATDEIAKHLNVTSREALFMVLQLNKFDTLRDISNGKGSMIITDGSSDSEMRSMTNMVAAAKNASEQHHV